MESEIILRSAPAMFEACVYMRMASALMASPFHALQDSPASVRVFLSIRRDAYQRPQAVKIPRERESTEALSRFNRIRRQVEKLEVFNLAKDGRF